MKTRFFFVIYLHDAIIKSILDGMRIIADPQQRNFSHITVKGPYQTIQKKILNKDNKLIQGKEIRILGAGNFFAEDQNTVFLKCEDKEELYEIWKAKEEKSYNEFHPHITIYDGGDRIFAKDLYNTINSYKINFSFVVEKLELYSSADKNKLFNLQAQVNYKVLSSLIESHVDQENISTLSNEQRILAIDKLCKILEPLDNIIKDSEYTRYHRKDHSLLVEA